MGPLMLDCAGTALTAEERERLAHPLVGGVILFSRNYIDKPQLAALIQDIRHAAKHAILIGVDHEGGRVQRFRQGFTSLPAMGALLPACASLPKACELAAACGHILAHELTALDIDLSFGPVLDINGNSKVIGDRAFAKDPATVVTLATSLIGAMQAQGMSVTGKHFPGHGSVEPDSHVALPVDERDFAAIEALDMQVFTRLIARLDGIMPAHVIYSDAAPEPAGFSPFWLQQILRQRLRFKGAIFSDDLSMHGASVAGDYPQRAARALLAGCDMVLACNNPAGACAILESLTDNCFLQQSGLSDSPAIGYLNGTGMDNPRLTHFNRHQAVGNAAQQYQHAVSLLSHYENTL